MKKISILVPCYNEEEVLSYTIQKLLNILKGLEEEGLISINSFIYLVDDGSSDNTFEIIKSFNKKTKQVKCVKFTRNFGNQSAILAGLMGARKLNVDCAITIDADLQQDEDLIRDFVLKYKQTDSDSWDNIPITKTDLQNKTIIANISFFIKKLLLLFYTRFFVVLQDRKKNNFFPPGKKVNLGRRCPELKFQELHRQSQFFEIL